MVCAAEESVFICLRVDRRGCAGKRRRLKIVFEAEQTVRPEFLIAAHPPLVNLADRDRVQRIHPLPSFFAGGDQTGVAQHLDVLHHAETRQMRKGLDNLRGLPRTLVQQVENRPPRGIGERFPDRVEVVSHRFPA